MSVGAISRSESVGYVPGSRYKRLQQSNMQKMNRAAVEAYNSAFNSGGTLVFDKLSAANTSRAEQIAEQVVVRIQSEAQAKLASYSLGDLLDTSA
jgi:hypothetical protein